MQVRRTRSACSMVAAGEALPPSKPLTGPAPPRRSVCAPGTMSLHPIADQPVEGRLPMSFTSWLRHLRSALSRGQMDRKHQRQGSLRAATFRPQLETLEDRCLLSFSPVVSYPVGAAPQAVVSGYFNNDSVLDLAVVNYSSSNVSVLLGNPDGTFQDAVNYDTGTGPRSIAVGDFDGDHAIDIATANAGDVSVLLGNGDGTFKAASSIALPGQFPSGYGGTDPL